jgi:uncharacterized protein YgiM (DUF1202 family)
MKRALLAVLLFAACAKEAPPAATQTVDTREPMAVLYVGTPKLDVRTQPNDTAEIMATYQNGEALSVLAEKGEWTEVRTGISSGWAKRADLATAEEKTKAESDPQANFRIMPLPVTAPGARGEIYIIADVNSDGEVTSTHIAVNTTGSAALANQNEAALRAARFHPMIVKNQRKPFKYYHRVTY